MSAAYVEALFARIAAGAPYNSPNETNISNYKPSLNSRCPLNIPPEGEDYTIRYHEIVNSKVKGSDGYTYHLDQDHAGILIGFYAPDAASFTFQISNKTYSPVDLPITLAAGEFQFALYNKYVYPSCRTRCWHPIAYENVTGKVYAVFAELSADAHDALCRVSAIVVADLMFISGMVGPIGRVCARPIGEALLASGARQEGRRSVSVEKPLFIEKYEDAVAYIEATK